MTRPLLVVLALACMLVACEKAQSGSSVRKTDTKVWDTGKNPFVAEGWKKGDEASWESQIRERNAAQNEYSRVPAHQ